MTGQPAMVLMEHELDHLLRTTARAAAQEVIDTFKADLDSDPTATIARKLRAYIEDRRSVADPRDHWANGLHIRMVRPSKGGKPRSVSWFQQFKVQSGLKECLDRKSLSVGGTREWCFEDIANAWERVQV